MCLYHLLLWQKTKSAADLNLKTFVMTYAGVLFMEIALV